MCYCILYFQEIKNEYKNRNAGSLVFHKRSLCISWYQPVQLACLDSTPNMPAHKVGRNWKFKVSEVDDWIKSGQAAEYFLSPYKEKEKT